MKARLLIGFILLVCMLFITVGCKKNVTDGGENLKPNTNESIKEIDLKDYEKHPKVKIQMENGGEMVLELYPEYAPETVKNFIKLTESGFYDGLKFHRIIKNFMIQGGDPQGNGTGGSDNTIKGEFSSNGFSQNTLTHTKGVISMARSDMPDSASSQFFIMHGTEQGLDGNYAAFGKLIEGEETLDEIANTPVDYRPNSNEQSLPLEEVKIKKAFILK